MLRLILAGLCLLQCATAFADKTIPSPSKMFKVTDHDFGSVPRAAKVEYRFKFKNIYDQPVHIANVRSSCGCTAPRAEKDTIAPGEEGAIIAAFNTKGFTGQHGAQLTISFDKPYWTEVQVSVRGYIRTDVVLNPGQVAFGSVDRGNSAEKKVAIEYAGRDDWKILEVKTPSPNLSAKVEEKSRGKGRVSYTLIVEMDKDVPAGYLRDQLVLVTNDRRLTQVPVNVEGFIVEELSVSPTNLMLGNLHQGQNVTKKLVVRGKEPFKILGIRCENGSFTFKADEESKAVHIVPVVFAADNAAGKFSDKITIETDMGGRTVELTASGQVIAPLAGN